MMTERHLRFEEEKFKDFRFFQYPLLNWVWISRNWSRGFTGALSFILGINTYDVRCLTFSVRMYLESDVNSSLFKKAIIKLLNEFDIVTYEYDEISLGIRRL
jgi:hypothetical protein